MFGVALLMWWRRRHATHHYPYSERAKIISEALHETRDLALIYWSKSQRKFLRRIVTPLELDGYSLKAFDHSINDVRVFKVTRIRQVANVQRGSRALPAMTDVVMAYVAVVGCGVLAVVMLGVAIYRGQATPAPIEASLAAATNSTIAPAPVVIPTAKSGTATADLWQVVVDNDASYQSQAVSEIIQRTLRCTTHEADELFRKIRAVGHAAVWQGQWDRAERIRQSLEGEDLLARVERAPTD